VILVASAGSEELADQEAQERDEHGTHFPAEESPCH
jgi:hypothetical protein